MGNIKMINNNHSIATDYYQRASKAIEKTNNLDRVEDIVSIGQKRFDLGGVEIKKAAVLESKDLLLAGDTIVKGDSLALVVKRKRDSFMKALKEKFRALVKSEETSRDAINYDATLLEAVSANTDANHALELLITSRDKLVNLWKDLLNTAI